MAKSLFSFHPLEVIHLLTKPSPMKTHLLFQHLLILFCVINLSNNILAVADLCHGHQQSLLLHLKNNLVFNPAMSKKLVHWNLIDDCCQWNGVTCNEGHVIALDLSEEFLSGGLDNSSSLFNLQYLLDLNLAFNSFHSVIPSEFQKLKNLRYLNLSNAGFEGHIPGDIFYLTWLAVLDLSISFTSSHTLKLENPSIETLVQSLTELTELYLDGVSILAKGNELCKVLTSLKNLQVLSMSSCNLLGTIDCSLAKLHPLYVIRLNQNNLSSIEPEFFVNFSNLTTLQLSNCGLRGKFPKGIFQIQTLHFLDLSDNHHLQGSLPNFAPHNSLHTLNLSNTNFSGSLPDSITNLGHLSKLDLSNCQFNGTLPSSMSKLTQLVHLDMSLNSFNGPLPSFNMSQNLTYLSLYHNNLGGQIPLSHFNGLKHLVSIDLGHNSLSGIIPSSLFTIPSLQELKLFDNKFDGLLDEIPKPSSSVLKILDLSGNNLQGPIPMSIFHLKSLVTLQLSLNNFNGSIQLRVFSKMENLTALGLSHNNFLVDATFRNDDHLSFFPNMSNIMLASCKLREFPGFLRNQSKLIYLDLSSNQIQGSIPNWIWRVDSLAYLNLSYNILTDMQGPFHNLSSNLLSIDLRSNQLQGSIPLFAKNAMYLDYSDNRFTSIIPHDFGNHIPMSFFLSVSNNSFHGTIHISICNASNLRLLDLSHNDFSGTIPECLTSSDNLGLINLRGNKLSGHIPDKFPTSCALTFFNINGNLLNGTIPRSLANCKKLQFLDLGNNMLIDRFPCFLGSTLFTLKILILRSNRLYGSIGCPNNISDWKMLQIVDLACNNFSGRLPGSLLKTWKAMMVDDDKAGLAYGNLIVGLYDRYDDPWKFINELLAANKGLGIELANIFTFELPQSLVEHLFYSVLKDSHYRQWDTITIANKGLSMKLARIPNVFNLLDLSSNHFEGTLPDELMILKALYVLNLSQNAFSGSFPSSIGNLKQLESLDLSNNTLTGEIPMELASLSFLSFLNLSFNHLKGTIPTGTQLQSFEASSFEGNDGLCGPPLTYSCNADGSHGHSPKFESFPTRSSIDWNFLSCELGFIFGLGLVILPSIFWRRWRLCYWKHVDELLWRIIPQLHFVYEQHGGKTYRTIRWTAH